MTGDHPKCTDAEPCTCCRRAAACEHDRDYARACAWRLLCKDYHRKHKVGAGAEVPTDAQPEIRSKQRVQIHPVEHDPKETDR